MKKIFLLAAVTFALAACDNKDNPDPSTGAAVITATIGESATSRASDDQWAVNDEIGILSTLGVEETKAGPYINVKYTTYDGKGKFEGNSIFFYKPMTLIAYYPFMGTPGKDPGIIEVKTHPGNQTKEKQPKIDFLWDSKTGINQQDFSVESPYVNFVFTHKMSKLTFAFKSSAPVYDPKDTSIMISDGVDVSSMVAYWIEGLGVTGTFNTSTGECALDPEVEREGLRLDFEAEPEKTGDEKYSYLRKFDPLIVFPQPKPEAEGKNFVLHVTTVEEGTQQNYKCTLTFKDNEIKPGFNYNFTIQVTKRGLIVGDLTIEKWTESSKFIIATVDGENDPEEQDPAPENP